MSRALQESLRTTLAVAVVVMPLILVSPYVAAAALATFGMLLAIKRWRPPSPGTAMRKGVEDQP